MQVKDFMKRNILFIHPDDSIRNASKMMTKYEIGSVLVLNKEKKLLGILTKKDIVRAAAEGRDLDKLLSKSIMSKGIVFVKPDDSLEDAADLMIDHRITKLPIEDEDGNLIGIITSSDIVLADFKFVKIFKKMMEAKNKDELEDINWEVSKFEYDI
ncbi:MAG: CBS domain-containing protein [Candidatus Aenigmatarchaeota archaeon]